MTRRPAPAHAPPSLPPTTAATLRRRLPSGGTIQCIGLRPARRAPVRRTDAVTAQRNRGLAGDRHAARTGGKRQVTLIQAEHLAVIASLLHREAVPPERVRRNLVVVGVNLLAFKDQPFRIGTAVLHGTGSCPPCPRMEEALGPGGYQAMRGHGGITAEILETGRIALGDALTALAEDASPRTTEAQR